MTYNEFQNTIVELLKKKLNEAKEVSIHKALKNNNCTLTGIIINDQKVNASPVIYLEEFFEQYLHGASFEKITTDILELYEKTKCKESLNTKLFKHYDSIKSKIVFKIINTKKNKELLKDTPHIHFLDLSIVFYALLDANENGTATMLVRHENMEMWGVNVHILLADAMKNVELLLPPELVAIQNMFNEITAPCFKPENILQTKQITGTGVMYVLSNNLCSFGAACMLYPGMFQSLGNILDSSYYILPSSIHETIILHPDAALSIEEMNSMVREVNTNQVEICDYLSDHVYFYDRSTQLIRACIDSDKWATTSTDIITALADTRQFEISM